MLALLSSHYFLPQETHIMHEFEADFYGSTLSVIMLGYIRGEENFSSIGRSISIRMLKRQCCFFLLLAINASCLTVSS